MVQFTASVQGTVVSMMRAGMTAEESQLYLNLPEWMTTSFAVGVFGGVLGSILLLRRS